jgi:hypothetical protein
MLRGYVKVATLTFVHKTIGQAGGSYVPNFGHSEDLIKMTDEMPLLLAPRDKFVTLNIFGRKFSSSCDCPSLISLRMCTFS